MKLILTLVGVLSCFAVHAVPISWKYTLQFIRTRCDYYPHNITDATIAGSSGNYYFTNFTWSTTPPGSTSMPVVNNSQVTATFGGGGCSDMNYDWAAMRVRSFKVVNGVPETTPTSEQNGLICAGEGSATWYLRLTNGVVLIEKAGVPCLPQESIVIESPESVLDSYTTDFIIRNQERITGEGKILIDAAEGNLIIDSDTIYMEWDLPRMDPSRYELK